jgi:hypothetical protein
MAVPTDQLTIFVSYSRAQVHFADELELYLSAQSHQVLLDRHGISKGEDFQERLGEMILACDTVVFVLSDESANSEVCAWEIEEATRLSKRILVVTLSDLSPGISPPEKLAGIDWIHCWNNPAVPGSSQTKGLIELDTALRTDVHWLRQCTEYQRQAANWARRGKKKDSPILLRDDMLTEALEFAQNIPANEDIPADVTEFFDKSSEYNATLKSKALTRAKAVRNTGLMGAAVSAVFFMIAVGFGYYALQQRDAALDERNEAERQSNLSFSRALAAQATTAQASDLDLSLLLSIEAFNAAPTLEARSALLSGLANIPHVDRFMRTSQEIPSGAISDNFCALSYSESTQTFAAPSIRDTGVLDLFSLPDGTPQGTHQIDRSNAAALSPDGTLLAYFTETGLQIYDLEADRARTVTRLNDTYGCVQFNANSDTVFFSSGPNVYRWAFETELAPTSFTLPSLRSIYRISPSQDGAYWLAAGFSQNSNRKSTVWLNFDSQEVLGEIENSILIAHDRASDTAAIANPTGLYTFKLGPASEAENSLEINWRNFEYGTAALAPGGTQAVIWNEGDLSLYDLTTGRALATNMAGYNGPIEAILFEPDGQHFVTMGRDDVLLRWSVTPATRLIDRRLPPSQADLFETAPGILYAGSLESARAQELDVLAQHMIGARADAEPMPESATTETANSENQDTPNLPLPRDVLDLTSRLAASGEPVLAALSPDRTLAARLTVQGEVELLNTRTLAPVATSTNARLDFQDIALLSPDRLLAIAANGAVWQCDRADAALTCARFAEQPPRESLRILAGTSPSQAYVLGYEEITLLNLDTGRVITNLAKGTGLGAPASATLDETGQVLAFSNGNNCVSFYDPNLVFPFAADLCPPTEESFTMTSALAFDATGETLLSAHSDQWVLWDLAPDSLMAKACTIANRNLSAREWARYMGERAFKGAC